MKSLFEKRVQLKPYEYPQFEEYIDAIRHSYWVHTEFNYTSDVQDFKVNVTPHERGVIKRAMLAIAQIEVAVKSFWGGIHLRFPKPEVAAVGATFAESEVRHMDAYSHLLKLLGLNTEFNRLEEYEVLARRHKHLEKILDKLKSTEKEDQVKAVLLFSLLTEHVSLFSQFLIIMSFNKHRNLFKGISNAIEATSKEEQVHGLFGIELIKLLKKEHPELFKEGWKDEIVDYCREIYETEQELISWIFKDRDLDFLKLEEVKNFVKQRINTDLAAIGIKPSLEVDQKALEGTEWFDNEVIATKHVDFFHKRSINYNKRSQSVTGNDLF